MKKFSLNGQWLLSGAKFKNLPATVPGCVHTDLRNNGLLPDYFWRKENDNCQWIENEDWTYSYSFDFNATKETVSLVFEGLDTYATVFLNGKELGKTQNMFIPHTFCVTDILKESGNLLEVKFRSPVKEVEGQPPLEGAFTTERMHTRRMQCTYYWDWVDRFVTCGIFLPVYLQIDNGFDVEDVYVYTEAIDDFGAGLRILTDFKNYEQGQIVRFEILAPNGETVYQTSQFVKEPQTELRLNISSPQLWWPNGYGEQPLYVLKIHTKENEYSQTFGIRTIRVAEIPDQKGSEYEKIAHNIKKFQKEYLLDPDTLDKTEESAGFAVIVNGVRIYCRGANWVPCEPFPSDESAEKITELIALAKESNMNMIRVWGGGVFEKDVFYDECDKQGILVTQDFLMACGTYPQYEEWFLAELKKESAFAAKKLRNHPCLAWWSGDNENATFGTDLLETYKGRNAALVGLAPQVRALDPMRRFHVSSPYGGTPYMSVTRGTSHTTNFFGEIFRSFTDTDCTGYKEFFENFLARMIVEEPVYGMPQTTSLLRFLTQEDLEDETEDVLRFHSKTNPCVTPTLYDYAKIFAEKLFGAFESTHDKLFKYEYLQYEWIRVVSEAQRRNIGYNDGLLFWMLNDCWPSSMCWSIIDYYNLPKAAWYSFKRCAKHVIGSIKKENGKFVLYLSSDGAKGVASILCHTRENIGVSSLQAEINGYGATKLVLPFDETEPFVICDISFNGETDRCFYTDGALPIEQSSGLKILSQTETSITLQAETYLHAVRLEGDYVFTDNYFSLLKGEQITVTFRKASINPQPAAVIVNAFTVKM